MIKAVVDKAKAFLTTRRMAYCQTFPPGGVHSDVVLRDLARFCRAAQSTFHPDPRAEGVLQGRREVWLRISQHLRLTDEELWDLLNG